MKTILLSLAVAFIAFMGAPAHAADPIYTSTFSNNAVGGYDTVSYFSGIPVKGNAEFSTQWNGATWRFANADNLAKFKSNPEKYAPQYGGYCAWAVAKGSLAKGDPKQWHIDNGKLYLNINASIKEKWLSDKVVFINEADKNFSSLIE